MLVCEPSVHGSGVCIMNIPESVSSKTGLKSCQEKNGEAKRLHQLVEFLLPCLVRVEGNFYRPSYEEHPCAKLKPSSETSTSRSTNMEHTDRFPLEREHLRRSLSSM